MYKDYAKHIGADEFLLKWVDTVLKNELAREQKSTEEVEHILDYMVQCGKKVQRMSYKDAKKLADAWTKTQQKKGKGIIEKPEDTEVVLDFKDGFKIVKLIGENAYKREGFLMSHCVGGYYGNGKEIYSLRDSENMPHCTMEKDQQIKGKGNGDIHPKYIHYVVKFLEHVGMTVGDSEMKHLGYVNIEKLLDEVSDETKKLTYNKKYFPKDKKELIKDTAGNAINHLGMLEIFPLVDEVDEKLKIMFDIPLVVSASVEWMWIKRKSKSSKVKDESVQAGGDDSQLAGGYYSKLAGGDRSQLAGGNESKLAGGDYSKLAGGNESQLAGGDRSQLAGGDRSQLAGGDYSKLAGGYYSKLAGGNESKLAGGDYSKLAGGNESQLAGGDRSQLAGGPNSKLAGGDYSQLAGGYSSQLAGGYSSQLAGGDRSQLAGGDRSQLAGGDYSKLAGGYYSKLAGGNESQLAGGNNSVMVGDHNSQVKGELGAVIVLVERNLDSERSIKHFKAGIIDGKKLKVDTWYKLVDGEFEEVTAHNV